MSFKDDKVFVDIDNLKIGGRCTGNKGFKEQIKKLKQLGLK